MSSDGSGETRPPVGLEAEKLQIERERLELDKTKTTAELKFLNRNLGAVVTGLIAIATTVVSLVQIHVARISKDAEIKIASEQRTKS
ncbi:MAG: hypothetical protein WCA49_14295 [Candidatus Sulfotelmatobacter sp.]